MQDTRLPAQMFLSLGEGRTIKSFLGLQSLGLTLHSVEKRKQKLGHFVLFGSNLIVKRFLTKCSPLLRPVSNFSLLAWPSLELALPPFLQI